MNGAAKLRRLLGQPGPVVIVGAHDGLGARLVEEAGFVSWRGRGGKDAPEHLRMGAVTPDLLSTLELPWRIAEPGEPLAPLVDALEGEMERARRPGALVVPKGVLA